MKISDFIRILFFVFVVRPFMVIFIGLRVYGKECLPKQHPFILVANHSSHLDAASLLYLFPLSELKNIRPVAAADYFERNWLISKVSHLFFNILPISRKCISKHANPLEAVERAINSNQSLIFFPEGTRSATGELGPLHSGVIHLIDKYPQLPIIPVYLGNMWRSLPKGEFVPVPFFCEIKIGSPLFLKGSRKEEIETLKNAILSLKDV